jgi:hypothetical protein
MSTDPSREDKALDALIAAAFRQETCEDLTLEELRRLESALTDEDKAALADLGNDFAERIAAGLWTPRSKPLGEDAGADSCVEELAGSMHRGDEGGDLTDAAREEMERKLRELDEGERGADGEKNRP